MAGEGGREMREFLHDMLIEPFTEYDRDWFSYSMGVFMWIITIAVGGFFLWILCMPIDRCGLSEKDGTGDVIEKYFEPAHSVTTYTTINGNMYPITTWYNDEWSIEIEVPAEDKSESVDISQSEFYNTPKGKQFKVKYYIGRLWRNLHITDLK